MDRGEKHPGRGVAGAGIPCRYVLGRVIPFRFGLFRLVWKDPVHRFRIIRCCLTLVTVPEFSRRPMQERRLSPGFGLRCGIVVLWVTWLPLPGAPGRRRALRGRRTPSADLLRSWPAVSDGVGQNPYCGEYSFPASHPRDDPERVPNPARIGLRSGTRHGPGGLDTAPSHRAYNRGSRRHPMRTIPARRSAGKRDSAHGTEGVSGPAADAPGMWTQDSRRTRGAPRCTAAGLP